jgi:hypothetical protein
MGQVRFGSHEISSVDLHRRSFGLLRCARDVGCQISNESASMLEHHITLPASWMGQVYLWQAVAWLFRFGSSFWCMQISRSSLSLVRRAPVEAAGLFERK